MNLDTLSEKIRLLYVALTRAKEEVIIPNYIVEDDEGNVQIEDELNEDNELYGVAINSFEKLKNAKNLKNIFEAYELKLESNNYYQKQKSRDSRADQADHRGQAPNRRFVFGKGQKDARCAKQIHQRHKQPQPCLHRCKQYAACQCAGQPARLIIQRWIVCRKRSKPRLQPLIGCFFSEKLPKAPLPLQGQK